MRRAWSCRPRTPDKHWTDYLNLAYQKAQGKNIVSGQSLFAPDELAYIANHYIYLDHDQTYTVSGGQSYRFGDNRVSGDVIYGSGLRRTPDDGAPNGGRCRTTRSSMLRTCIPGRRRTASSMGRLGS